ncbi:MAG: ATP-binding cassette domain-containing protein, partial [Caldilineaceae bacterium]|nr:ATP-binding cassette domain-containing protein [Caldilineaceae bacterium]
MSNFAIQVEGIGKKYHIGGLQTQYQTMRDSLANAFTAPIRRARSLLSGHSTGAADLHEEIWALKDVSFTINHGEVVGLIGRNGAGKSTLLKILAGREQPDNGAVTLAASVTVGHLDQEQETLDVRGTLFDAYRGDRVGDWEELKAELLGYGLFVYEDLHKPAAALSVGQKRKLQIARLIAQGANLLLLDEPTNHV